MEDFLKPHRCIMKDVILTSLDGWNMTTEIVDQVHELIQYNNIDIIYDVVYDVYTIKEYMI
jgi:hypothetical protein